MNKIFYICQRNGQCVRPCDENCLYTSDFFKSKMYHDSVKRIDTIPFLADKQGDIWEVDMTWDKNLPKELRQVPESFAFISLMFLMAFAGLGDFFAVFLLLGGLFYYISDFFWRLNHE